MKSYNQLNVDTYSVFLKEWNALSEETRREILEEIIEENELEVSEEELKEVALTLGTSPIWAPKVAGALMTAVGAGGMIYQSTRRRNKDKSGESGKSLEQRVNAKNSQGAGGSPNQLYRKKTNTPGDNPEERANIRDMLNKLNKKNNKLYNDYHNPKPSG